MLDERRVARKTYLSPTPLELFGKVKIYRIQRVHIARWNTEGI